MKLKDKIIYIKKSRTYLQISPLNRIKCLLGMDFDSCTSHIIVEIGSMEDV